MVSDRARAPERGLLQAVQRSPIRSGLIGLAVAGTAAPIALNQYQDALRIDPTHESAADPELAGSANEESLQENWRAMEQDDERSAASREQMIARSMEKYAEFNLERALAEQIYDAATANNIDPEVAYGLVKAESSFKNTSTSGVGAIGLTQLMPKTAAGLQPGVTTSELREPNTNLRIGFKYLRDLIDKYEGNEDLALTAYNRGPGTVDKALRRGADPDNGYAAFVRGEEGHGHRLYTNR